jgi:hypothetical protein
VHVKNFPETFNLPTLSYCAVILLETTLLVDGQEIPLNEFVVQILSGTVVGAVTSLRGIKKDWKQIEVKVKK